MNYKKLLMTPEFTKKFRSNSSRKTRLKICPLNLKKKEAKRVKKKKKLFKINKS